MLRSTLNKILEDLSISKRFTNNKLLLLVNYLKNTSGLHVDFQEIIDTTGKVTLEKVTIKNHNNENILDLRYSKDKIVYSTLFIDNCISFNSESFSKFKDRIRLINDELFRTVRNNNGLVAMLNRIDDRGNIYNIRTDISPVSDSLDDVLEDIVNTYSQWLFTDIILAFGEKELENLSFLDRFPKDTFKIRIMDSLDVRRDMVKALDIFS